MSSDSTTQDKEATYRRQINRLLRSLERSGIAIDGDGDSLLPIDADAVQSIIGSRLRLQELLIRDERLKALDSLGENELEGLRLELSRLCVEGRLQQQLAEADIPYPIYNFFASFAENRRGPWSRVQGDREMAGAINWKLMGIPVKFPIGVPASGLTQNPEWIEYFANRGYNILTFKTVRSAKHAPHHYPHWVFIDDIDPWHSKEDIALVRGDLETWPKTLSRFSTANSFGVPSPPPDKWQADVARAQKRMANGQLLILSVMGTNRPDDQNPTADLIEDFANVARMAEATGVRAIELNLSCPNTVKVDEASGMSPPISSDPEKTRDVVLAVKARLQNPETRIVAKLGYESPEILEQIVKYIGSAIDGISGINTVQTKIKTTDSDHSPFIGTFDNDKRERDMAGVSGSAIRELGLDFVTQIHHYRETSGHSFSIIGMGGVTSPGDVDDYLRAGADAVQSATGACLNPELPFEVMERSRFAGGGTGRTRQPTVCTAKTKKTRLEKVFEVMASGGYSLLSDRSGGAD